MCACIPCMHSAHALGYSRLLCRSGLMLESWLESERKRLYTGLLASRMVTESSVQDTLVPPDQVFQTAADTDLLEDVMRVRCRLAPLASWRTSALLLMVQGPVCDQQALQSDAWHTQLVQCRTLAVKGAANRLCCLQNHMRRKKTHELPLATPDLHAQAMKVRCSCSACRPQPVLLAGSQPTGHLHSSWGTCLHQAHRSNGTSIHL